jgi:hypothetical protein
MECISWDSIVRAYLRLLVLVNILWRLLGRNDKWQTTGEKTDTGYLVRGLINDLVGNGIKMDVGNAERSHRSQVLTLLIYVKQAKM